MSVLLLSSPSPSPSSSSSSSHQGDVVVDSSSPSSSASTVLLPLLLLRARAASAVVTALLSGVVAVSAVAATVAAATAVNADGGNRRNNYISELQNHFLDSLHKPAREVTTQKEQKKKKQLQPQQGDSTKMYSAAVPTSLPQPRKRADPTGVYGPLDQVALPGSEDALRQRLSSFTPRQRADPTGVYGPEDGADPTGVYGPVDDEDQVSQRLLQHDRSTSSSPSSSTIPSPSFNLQHHVMTTDALKQVHTSSSSPMKQMAEGKLPRNKSESKIHRVLIEKLQLETAQKD